MRRIRLALLSLSVALLAGTFMAVERVEAAVFSKCCFGGVNCISGVDPLQCWIMGGRPVQNCFTQCLPF